MLGIHYATIVVGRFHMVQKTYVKEARKGPKGPLGRRTEVGPDINSQEIDNETYRATM